MSAEDNLSGAQFAHMVYDSDGPTSYHHTRDEAVEYKKALAEPNLKVKKVRLKKGQRVHDRRLWNP